MDNEFSRRNDRSYLCLVAIYVIHAFLLNVFLQPQLQGASGVTVSGASYVRGSTKNFRPTERNDAKNCSIVVAMGDDTMTINSTNNRDERTNEENDDDYNGKITLDEQFYQSKSSGAAIRILTVPTISLITRIANNALDNARQIFKNLSPAALGILSGCFVFLLTFTDNVPTTDKNKDNPNRWTDRTNFQQQLRFASLERQIEKLK